MPPVDTELCKMCQRLANGKYCALTMALAVMPCKDFVKKPVEEPIKLIK